MNQDSTQRPAVHHRIGSAASGGVARGIHRMRELESPVEHDT